MQDPIEKIFHVTGARGQLGKILDAAVHHQRTTVLTRYKKKAVVIMPYEEYIKSHPEEADSSGS